MTRSVSAWTRRRFLKLGAGGRGALEPGSPSAAPARAIRASCSSSCAAHSMGSRPCRLTPIRTTRACAASWRSARRGPPTARCALDGLFGLHPGLRFLHEATARASCSYSTHSRPPYRERSHFDGQDVLESGLTRAACAPDRLAQSRAAAVARTRSAEPGVALGQNVPLVLRGPAQVRSWSPSKLPELDEDTLQRIADRYASDELWQRLADALATDPMMAEPEAGRRADGASAAAASRPSRSPGAKARYARPCDCRRFLRQAQGPRVAVFDTTGWDTHFNEGGAQGQLTGRLAALDPALRV